jgi:hypothetical protein
MATVFVLGTLLAHRAGSWFALPLFALGLLSKENAIVALGLVIAHDLLRPATTGFTARRKLYAGYGVVAIAYVATLGLIFHDKTLGVTSATFADASLGTRLWTMASVIPEYVRLLLFPAALSADYEPQVIPAVQHLTVAGAVGMSILVAYVAAIAIYWRRDRRIAFGLIWVAITLAPVSNVFFASGVTLSERSLYLPSAGVVLTLGMIGQSLLPHFRTALLVAAATMGVAAALRTWTRTPVWRNDRTFVLTLLSDHPESFRAHWVAGRVYSAMGQLNDAQRELRIARQLHAKVPGVYVDAAVVAERLQDVSGAALLRDSAAALRARGLR